MVVSKTVIEYYEGRRISSADLVMEPDGSVQLVTSTGLSRDPIRLHRLTTDVRMRLHMHIPECTCTPLGSIFAGGAFNSFLIY